jgi:hypothetical protein
MMTLGEGRSVCRTIQTRCISGHGVPHQMRKPAPLVTPWTKTGQNLAEGGPFGLQAELERRVKRKSRLRPCTEEPSGPYGSWNRESKRKSALIGLAR